MTRYFPSEWAAQSAIQFTFPHEDSDWQPMLDVVVPCFARLIEAVSKYQKVIVICKNTAQTVEILESLHNRIYLLEIVRQMRAPRSLHSQEARLMLYEKLVSLMSLSQFDEARALLEYLIQTDCDSLLPLLD